MHLCILLEARNPMDRISAERAEELASELSLLSQQQSEALLMATYIRLSPEEAKKYDQRRLRITEISAILGRFKAQSIEPNKSSLSGFFDMPRKTSRI
jgi:hypothetical protein